MDGANLGSRHTAIHAIQVLCDCWDFGRKPAAKKVSPLQRFEIAAVSNAEAFRDRIGLTDFIYNTNCPTLNDLRDLPPTEDLYEGVRVLMLRKSNNLGSEIDAFVQQQRLIGQQQRADRAERKRRKRGAIKTPSATVAPPSAMRALPLVQPSHRR